jgi:acyl transferase domain-containing protein
MTAERSAAEIASWIVARISAELQVDPAELDPREPFSSYGITSKSAVILSGDLMDWLGRDLSPTLFYEYPTIEALTRHLAQPSTSAPEPAAAAGEGGRREPVAIVGIGCRFPGAHGPSAFWDLLEKGVDAIREVPAGRWVRADNIADSQGGFVDGVDLFDASFFGISPREAALMDPQQRLVLETAWEALEDACIPPESLAGTRTGVFIGISTSDYSRILVEQSDFSDPYAATGNALSITANRLSYLLDVRGPSLAVDTACSSSLVAVHLACQSLWNGEATMALAGGVNLILSPHTTANFVKAGMMSPDGRCKAFDERANGYVRGEGAGVVVLKPLSRALEQGDPIYAVLRGTAVNQDGRSNGLTAPTVAAQEAVLRDAYARAGVAPGEIQYVEAHGTGTALGDPIEVKALGAVLAIGRAPGSRCAIGSVKTNIGHLEAAAGVAGLIKVALSLSHERIPPSLHFLNPNPHIAFDKIPVAVQQSLGPWPEAGGRALAGVSSFGFGGTNAHVVLEKAPPDFAPEERAGGRASLFVLSTRSADALRVLAARCRDQLAGASIDDLCYTASLRRSHYDHRLAIVADSTSALMTALDAFVRDGPLGAPASRRAEAPFAHGVAPAGRKEPLAFVLSGGKLPPELCRELADFTGGEDDSPMALAALWASWGIVPDAVVGEGAERIAAALGAPACGSVEELLEKGFRTFIEIGGDAAATAALPSSITLVSLPAGRSALLKSAGALYAVGHEINGETLARPRGRVVRFPSYPWQRRSHWIKREPRDEAAASILGSGLDSAEASERSSLLQDYLRRVVAASFDIAPSEVSVDEPITNMGLDSLTAAELTNRIETEVGVPVPMVRLLQGPTIAQLAGFLGEQMSTRDSPAAPPVARGEAPPNSASLDVVAVRARLDQLSDDQVGALLDKLLASKEIAP